MAKKETACNEARKRHLARVKRKLENYRFAYARVCLGGRRSQGRDLVFTRTCNAERVSDHGEREKEKGRETASCPAIRPKLRTTGMHVSRILNACPRIRLSKRKLVSQKQDFKG